MKKIFLLLTVAALTFSACSDNDMESVNTDYTKTTSIDPNAQLTTSLLQTYGDFIMTNFHRCYTLAFTQHFSGNWNICNYGGSNHQEDDINRLMWDRYYPVAINNLTDAIKNSTDRPNLNAVLRIHKVYLMSVLTDTYGDIPCSKAGKGLEGVSNPKYDTQEEIYNWFFEELKACVEQLGTGSDRITGDVTSMKGDVAMWKKYANSLRMRFAMRISDKDDAKAKTEFEAAINDPAGYIRTDGDDAYIIYLDTPITKDEGARDGDFRYNALGAILYGQDGTNPMFVCATFYEILKKLEDPRLYRICRYFVNTMRSDLKPDYTGNVDLTDEIRAFREERGWATKACEMGEAWYDDWIGDLPNVNPNDPNNNLDKLPKLKDLITQYPDAGFDSDASIQRLNKLWLSIDFERADNPGTLMNSAEVEFLLAEAKLKWNIPSISGTMEDHFRKGVKASLVWMNAHYLPSDYKMTETEINDYVNGPVLNSTLANNAKEAINTQAWILHMMNPAEAWANLRRSDYPRIKDRELLPTYKFTYDDNVDGQRCLKTPTRICYPASEKQYNSANYAEAIGRMGGSDDWHAKVWWDKNDINLQQQ